MIGLPEDVREAKELLLAVLDTKVGYRSVRGVGGGDTETGLPEDVREAKELLLAVLDTKVGYRSVRW